MGHLSAVGGAPASKRLVAMVAGFYLPCGAAGTSRLIDRDHTVTQRHRDPRQSARGLNSDASVGLTATKLKIAVRMATMEATLHGTIMLLVEEDLLQ